MTREVDKASKKGVCATAETFANIFGSFNKALIEAKLGVNIRKGYSKKELIFMLHSLAKELGGVPFSGDVTEASQRGKAGEYASLRTFVNVFGTFNKALKAAGMKPNHEKKLISK